jgi:hypothetical protein
MGRRKAELCGVGPVRECGWVLEWHWLWEDVQVEAVLSEMRGCGKWNGALGGSGIAAHEEST